MLPGSPSPAPIVGVAAVVVIVRPNDDDETFTSASSALNKKTEAEAAQWRFIHKFAPNFGEKAAKAPVSSELVS